MEMQIMLHLLIMVYYHTCENYTYVRSYHHLPNIVNTVTKIN